MMDDMEERSSPVALVDVLYATISTGIILWILTLESVQDWLFNHWFLGVVSLAVPFIAFPAGIFASRDARQKLRG